MPSTYTTNNGIELIATGEQSGTWGSTTNSNLTFIDTSLDGHLSVTLASAGTSGSPNTLPITDGSASNGRNRAIIFTDGGDLGADVYVQLTPNDAKKIMFVRNSLSGSRNLILFQGTYNASNDFVLAAGKDAIVKFDGAGAGAVAAAVLADLALDAATIGTLAATTINATTVNATTFDMTNLEVTNIKAKDGTASATIADSTGVMTIGSSVLTTTDINGGTIDGVTIGGASAGAGTFTTLTATGNLTVDTNTLFVDAANNRVGVGTNSPATTFDLAGIATITDTGNSVGSNTPLTIKSNNGVATTSYGWDNLTSNFDYIFKTNGALRAKIADNGDISFYEDTGTTPKFFWDASAEALGIGTTTPAQTVQVQSSGSAYVRTKSAFSGTSFTGVDFGQSTEGHAIILNRDAQPMRFFTSDAERMRIDSSGNVGIGLTSPTSPLHVKSNSISSAASGIAIQSNANSNTIIALGEKSTDGGRFHMYDGGVEKIAFYTDGTNNHISAGNVGIGTSSPGARVEATASSAVVQILNRTTSDGDILQFEKDGTTVGSIGSYFGDLYIASPSATDAGIRIGNSIISPVTTTGAARDNAIDLGQSSARWKNLYLSGGVYLGGTTSANLLDDYEEGTFTPVVADASSGGNEATALRAYGYYTKIGRWVNIVIELTDIDTTGLTSANDVKITGLPFAAGNLTGVIAWQGTIQVASVDLSATTPYITPTLVENTSALLIREWGDNVGTDSLEVGQLTSGGADINITMGYQTS